MASNTTKTIGNVIKQAREKYEELMQSEYISVGMRIDGVVARGQAQNNEAIYSAEDKNSKLMTCSLNINVKRGSSVEIEAFDGDDQYSMRGLVTSIPNRTPVDYYFTTLMFNATVKRVRNGYTYNDDGDIVNNDEDAIENIPCYVERVGMRERQVDAGIERNSVNKIIAHKDWDLQKGDIISVESNVYRITDKEELENDMLSAYMTFYRE